MSTRMILRSSVPCAKWESAKWAVSWLRFYREQALGEDDALGM